MKKILISWVVCVLGLVALLVWLGSDFTKRNKTSEGPPIQAEFVLQGGDGKLVRASDLRGKYLLVYFGFTHCPDICPTTLLLMNNALTQLGKKSSQIQPIFISVDPKRDTPKLAADYARHFSPSILGLSGTPEQVKQAADSFKVYYSEVKEENSAVDYVVDHSGFIYLMGPDGAYVGHFPSTISEAELSQELTRYVR